MNNNKLTIWNTGTPTTGNEPEHVDYGAIPGAVPDPNAMNENALRDDALTPEDFVWKRKAADRGYAGFTHEMVDELEAMAVVHRNRVARQAKARDEANKG
ncbi:MAG: hypothetical protein ACK5TD_00775 [bacterium]|jgi:hypothetical protein